MPGRRIQVAGVDEKDGSLKVLLLTHRIPFPPDKGDKIRSFHLLSNLAASHEVDLVGEQPACVVLAKTGRLNKRCALKLGSVRL